ncbi:MAG: hypothetical protein AAGJ83_07750, partial [Planctomycetota bacterium]
MSLARCAKVLLLSVVLFSIDAAGRQGSAAENNASPERLSLRGGIVYRWAIGDAQASLLDGDCELTFAGKTLRAERILVVT